MKNSFVDQPSQRIFDEHWDLIVVGGGYAGFAAAFAADEDSKKVLLIDPGCVLLWESALARHPVSERISAPLNLSRTMACVTGIAESWIDPGSAEWVANELLIPSAVERLYYALPIAARLNDDGTISSVTVALRDRLAVLHAKQWIDTTEDGLLLKACNVKATAKNPKRYLSRVFLQSPYWGSVKLPKVETKDFKVFLEDSEWSSERILRVEHKTPSFPRREIEESMKSFFSVCPADDILTSHWSYSPYPVYGKAAGKIRGAMPSNLALASAAFAEGTFERLDERFDLGVKAYNSLNGMPSAEKFDTRIAKPKKIKTVETDIFVAGLGTGGLFAAITAASEGNRVLAIDPEVIPGGVATHGGIHAYYYGCPGGLQESVDKLVKEKFSLLGSDKQIQTGYHALARLLASLELLDKSGAETIFKSRLIPSSVKTEKGRILSALVWTPKGIIKVSSKSWIDATGEGFLAIDAGVPYTMGRDGDGSLHAFTQSWGAFGYFSDGLKLFITNTDSGYVDPTDSLDMTTARIHSMNGLVRNSTVNSSNCFNRSTGVMPSVGIRQGPLLETRYMLTVDDMVGRRRFDDAIGFTGGHVDNHSTDYFMEGHDLAFYNWCAKGWSYTTCCEIPYRQILPAKINNLWIACRAAGGTEEASNAFRMQRDMQRIGEAAGYAASIACRYGKDNGEIPLSELQNKLRKTGALAPLDGSGSITFSNGITTFDNPDDIYSKPATEENLRLWVKKLSENGSMGAWCIFRQGKEEAKALLKRYAGADDMSLFYSALILAAHGDSSAGQTLTDVVAGRRNIGNEGYRGIPSYVSAAWALAHSGGDEAVKPLTSLACDKTITPLARMTALWSLGTIAGRMPKSQAIADAVTAVSESTLDITDKLRPWEAAYLRIRLMLSAKLTPDEDDLNLLKDCKWKLVRLSLAKLLK